MPNKHNEANLQANCVSAFYAFYPHLYGLLFMNYNNPKSARHGGLLRRMGLVAGIADMTFLSPNGAIFIELKLPTGKQTQRQKQWQKIAEDAGYKYYIARNVREFLNIIGHEQIKK